MGTAAEHRDGVVDVDLVATQFDVLDSEMHRKALLEAIRARDAYRKLIDQLKEKIAKLEQGLIGPKSERYKGEGKEDDPQLSLQILTELLGAQLPEGADAEQLAAALLEQARGDAQSGGGSDGGDGGGEDGGDERVHRRPRKPTGRSTKGEHVHKLTLELLPEEVKRLGLDAFERIGQETSTTIERRISSLVEVTIVRPKFRAKTAEAQAAVQQVRAEAGTLPEQPPESWITVAPAPELPLPRAMAGPGLLANVAVRRFDEHLPYNRLENVYEREGMRLGRSTLYGWLDALRELFAPLIAAIRADARGAPYLCVDATGVLVQAPQKCSRGHFWVLVAPGRHVVFAFSHSHDSDAVDKLLGGYDGFVVADAHTVYDHLYGDDGATEVACWGHARSYFFKALGSEPEIAREVLTNLRVMFMLERKLAQDTRKQRERMRQSKVKVLVDRHFELCKKHEDYALDDTPLYAAIRYSLNQEQALRRFLDDGRLPATNNISERQLRRQAIGRKNWLFVGSDDGAEVNTTFATLIASCHLNDIEPESYLREVICLLPDWPKSRVLDLAPCNWKQTRQQPDAQQLLDDNIWLFALREIDAFHARSA
jgi:transposase